MLNCADIISTAHYGTKFIKQSDIHTSHSGDTYSKQFLR